MDEEEQELTELYRIKQELLTEILNSQLGITTANSLARDINKKAERYKELFLKYNENYTKVEAIEEENIIAKTLLETLKKNNKR